MDGRIVRCGIISSCQSAAASEIVKRFWFQVYSCKKRCGKYRDSDLCPPPWWLVAAGLTRMWLSSKLVRRTSYARNSASSAPASSSRSTRNRKYASRSAATGTRKASSWTRWPRPGDRDWKRQKSENLTNSGLFLRLSDLTVSLF